MSDKKQTKTPTILTLTLPDPGGEGTLLIQRGDLAHVRQFACTPETDFTAVIWQALGALVVIESNPPVVPDAPPEKAAAHAAPPEPEPLAEPMVNIPVKKGKVTIPQRFLQVPNGDPSTEIYQQAVLIAGRLMDGKLWDGKCPICIADVDAVQGKLKHLSDKDLSLFALEDFAQRVPETASIAVEAETHDELDAGADDLPTDDDPAPEEAATPELPTDSNQPGLI